MRERVYKTGVLLTFLALPLLVWGQPAAAGQSPTADSAGEKIGVINIQQAIAATAEGKKAFGDLQKKYQPRQENLQKQQQEIQSLQDQLQRQQTTLSDSERIRLTRELSDKQKIFDRAREDAQSDFQQDRQDVMGRIGEKMVQIISDYAKQNGYSLILDAQIPIVGSNQVSDAQIPIYFASKDVDISDEIVKRYDAAFPVASASAPDASKPAGTTASRTAAKPPAKPKP
jgi:Skp family chaperone for outer membrane proteins